MFCSINSDIKTAKGMFSSQRNTQNEVYLKYRELLKEIDNRISYYESEYKINKSHTIKREILKLQLLKKQTNKNYYNK